MSTAPKSPGGEGRADHKRISLPIFLWAQEWDNFSAPLGKPKGAHRHTLASSVKSRETTVLESTAEQGMPKRSGSVKVFAQ